MLQAPGKEYLEPSITKEEDTSLSSDNTKLKKDWSSVKDTRQEESNTFGTRLLENKEDVWHHNAW